jgi:hypothetical protein
VRVRVELNPYFWTRLSICLPTIVTRMLHSALTFPLHQCPPVSNIFAVCRLYIMRQITAATSSPVQKQPEQQKNF